jgi:hypothetical protein
MATTKELEERLASLQKIRAAGLRSVKRGDREMTFRSDSEIVDAINELEEKLSGSARRRVFLTTTIKGL